MPTAISVENVSKTYRLGQITGRTVTEDLNRWWARVRGKPNPYLKLGRVDHGNRRGEVVWALKDVSCEIDQGDVLGIVGRNGAGKSTLLKILSRVTAPTSGTIRLRGAVASLLEVGTGFHPDLTGEENIYLNGAILGMNRQEIRRKFDDIVAFSDLAPFVGTPVKRYSSGMYVRLAFAVAAFLEREILVVDEVLAVGDTEFQQRCLGKMGDIAKHGRTVLLVSHQLNQIRRLCTRTLWIERGEIAQDGSTADVLARYEEAMVQDRQNPGGRSGGKAKFVSWTIDGQKGVSAHTLGHADSITLELRIAVMEALRSCHHGIALLDQDNRLLWGWSTDDLKFVPGDYVLRYTLPSLPVKPGVYTVKTSLYDQTGLIDLWDWAPRLVVGTPPVTHKNDQWAGFLNIPCTLEVHPAVTK